MGTINRLTRFSRIVQGILLGLVLLLGIGIRLLDIKDPPLDFHPVRQLRSALIARSIYYQLDPAFPSNMRELAIQTGRLEEYEPPILETLVALGYLLVGSEQLWIARVLLAFFWGIGGLTLYFLCRKFVSFSAALAGLAFYFFLPFSVIASRSFQPDPWMVMWILLFAFAIYQWSISLSWKWTIITGILAGVAILVKVVAVFFILGMLVVVAVSCLGWKKLILSIKFWIILGLCLAPALTYYLLFLGDRSSSFFSYWFVSLSWMIFTGEFYADWLAMVKSLMGLMTFLIAILGTLISTPRIKPVMLGAWFGYGIYGLIFPYQYVTHEYYHLPLVALVAISIVFLVENLNHAVSQLPAAWRVLAAGAISLAAFYGLYVARSVLVASDYRSEPFAWQKIGEVLPSDANVIALTGDYGMRLRYYGWRIVDTWPSTGDQRLSQLSGAEIENFQESFNELTAGKDYFLVTSFSQFEQQPELRAYLSASYPIYQETDDFLIYKLK